jgi:hypothetical protein
MKKELILLNNIGREFNHYRVIKSPGKKVSISIGTGFIQLKTNL